MAKEHKEHALAEEVLADARRQAERKLSRAKSTAERIVKSAHSQAAGIEEKALAEAKARLEHESAIVMADLPHQTQVRTLRSKDEAIGSLFAESLAALAASSADDRAAVLARLSLDGIAQMPGDAFTLEVSERDAAELGDRLARDVVRRAQSEHGRTVAVAAVASAALPEGGVIVKSADDRRLIDNSFATRMLRARASLRGQIAQILFGEDTA